MRKAAAVTLGWILLFVVGVAGAAEVTGKITAVDQAARTFVLEDGTKIVVAQTMPMDALKEGITVRASFEELGGMNIATEVKVVE